MQNIIYEDKLIKVEIEEFEIPWLKIFTKEKIKEFSLCSRDLRIYILDTLDIIEKIMLQQLKCDKINISSFGNYVPHLHFHIQARYKNDSYFPEPTWGKKQREAKLNIDKNNFFKLVKNKLEEQKLDK